MNGIGAELDHTNHAKDEQTPQYGDEYVAEPHSHNSPRAVLPHQQNAKKPALFRSTTLLLKPSNDTDPMLANVTAFCDFATAPLSSAG